MEAMRLNRSTAHNKRLAQWQVLPGISIETTEASSVLLGNKGKN